MDRPPGDFVLSLLPTIKSNAKNELLLTLLFDQLDCFELFQLYRQIEDNGANLAQLESISDFNPNYWNRRIKQFIKTYHHFNHVNFDNLEPEL